MTTVALADVCEVVMGQAPPGQSYNAGGNGIPLLAGASDFGSFRPRPSRFTTQPTRVSQLGDILLCVRATIGDRNLSDRQYCLGRGVAAIRSRSPDVDMGYVWHWLAAARPTLERRARGSTFKQVTREAVESLRLPLPPLAEQRRIAALLDKANSLRAKRLGSAALLDALLSSAFFELFGDPVKNDRNWKVLPASHAISSIEAGLSVGGDARARKENEWAVLKISAVTSGVYKPKECKVVDTVPDRLVEPAKGDLLFSRANTRELVAATCLVDREEPRVFLPDKLWRITPNAEVADAAYLRYLLAHRQFRERLTAQATGTSDSMLNVSQEKLLRLELPLPPLGLQREFSVLVWKTIETREKMEDAAGQADLLLASIMQSAFHTGTMATSGT